MTSTTHFEIFLAAVPGLEAALAAEARDRRYQRVKIVPGGVTFNGRWNEVWRANLELRGASRVLARIGEFRAVHLSELERRARGLEWGRVLRADVPFRVEATCRTSRIYHSGAAQERVETAIGAVLGAPQSDAAEVTVMVRIVDDLCTLAVDTSGELLHKRGFKEVVGKAPMRETMAALFLRMCGYDGREPVLDPMCGSGTFVIEAAEMAAGLAPGRGRSFAFERLATFDAVAWQAMRADAAGKVTVPSQRFHGSDRDAGAVEMSRANAVRAGVAEVSEFRQSAVSDVVRPDGPPGLVIVNPPYGGRLGDKARLIALYRALGATLNARFSGWRVGLVTSEAWLAAETGLPFLAPSAPISHGGLRVKLFQTGPLP